MFRSGVTIKLKANLVRHRNCTQQVIVQWRDQDSEWRDCDSRLRAAPALMVASHDLRLALLTTPSHPPKDMPARQRILVCCAARKSQLVREKFSVGHFRHSPGKFSRYFNGQSCSTGLRVRISLGPPRLSYCCIEPFYPSTITTKPSEFIKEFAVDDSPPSRRGEKARPFGRQQNANSLFGRTAVRLRNAELHPFWRKPNDPATFSAPWDPAQFRYICEAL